jgi:sugar phosphate isomerase/epimerase
VSLLHTSLLAGLCVALLACAAPQAPVRDAAAAQTLGFQLGVQAWTFRDRTAFEAIASAHRLGLRYIELYPGQVLAPGSPDVKVGPEMGAGDVAALRQQLAAQQVAALSFGVVNFTADEAAARKVFEFARTLGLANVSAEPEPDALDLVSRLADEYGIRVAFHNHPQGSSRYWNPEAVLAAIQGRSPRLGDCADTGHWTRSGLHPVDCLKQMAGHVIEVHFKDLNAFGQHDATDVPWGEGQSDARGILAELKRQGFRGLICVEYETGTGAELEANVAKCIAFFDATARELLVSTRIR